MHDKVMWLLILRENMHTQNVWQLNNSQIHAPSKRAEENIVVGPNNLTSSQNSIDWWVPGESVP